MKHAISTHLLVNHRLTSIWLDRIWDAGVPAVEIFCAKQHLDWRDRGQVAEIGHWFRDAPLKLHSLHSPMYNDDVWGRSGPQAGLHITEPIKAKRIAIVDEIKRVLEIAETVPFRYLIQHLGAPNEEYDERKADAAFNSLEELTIFARQRGVELLLENIPNGFSSAARLKMFLEMTHLDLNFCFDTGHAHIMEDVESEFASMKTRIRSTHVHDNDGKEDKHLFPYISEGGTIDWPQLIRQLASRPEQYPLLLELKEQPGMEHPLQAVKQVFERLDSLMAEPVR
ncbi:MAG TPA: sugar phosphate isomerase/epimerase family protein [Bryobacteraceae bacterium]|nr:sugar phosphate isomerase/epimerase family protein [Bryobacteraceae bacterium]